MHNKFQPVNQNTYKKYPFMKDIIGTDYHVYYRVRKIGKSFLDVCLLQKKYGTCRVYKDLYIIKEDNSVEKVCIDPYATIGKVLLQCYAEDLKKNKISYIIYDEFNMNNADGIYDKITIVSPQIL